MIFTGIANPLLIVRDPVALFILIKSISSKLFKINGYIIIAWIVNLICIPIAVFNGHGSILIAIYGARIFMIHFPLIFIIGKIFTIEDVIKLGKVVLGLIIPMTILIATQFYSPQSALVNRGVGGDEKGGGFAGTDNFFRPPGTFSFTTGNVQYYCFACCFLFFFWLSNKELLNRTLLICYTIAFLIAFPMCISRTLFFQMVLTFIFCIIATSKNSKITTRLIVISIVAGLVFLILGNTSFFQTSFGAFSERFTSANETEGGVKGVLIDRFLGGLIGALVLDNPIPFFGYGIGLGTNVGAQLATGSLSFLLAEGEWGRLVGEMGFIFGFSIILLRIVLGMNLLMVSYKSIVKMNNLPWVLMSFTFLTILQSQFSQPTSLGFAVLLGGIVFASVSHDPV